MNKKVLYYGALCLSLGFFACSEEDTESIPVSPVFEITNPSPISLQEGENDTLILATHLDLDSLKLVCQIETEGEYSVPTSFSMGSKSPTVLPFSTAPTSLMTPLRYKSASINVVLPVDP